MLKIINRVSKDLGLKFQQCHLWDCYALSLLREMHDILEIELTIDLPPHKTSWTGKFIKCFPKGTLSVFLEFTEWEKIMEKSGWIEKDFIPELYKDFQYPEIQPDEQIISLDISSPICLTQYYRVMKTIIKIKE